jgi:hypothetical protein
MKENAASRDRTQRRQLDMRGDEVSHLGKNLCKARLLLGLHQAEVTLGQRDRCPSRQGTEHADSSGFHARARQRFVPRARDAVEHDAGERDILAQRGKAKRCRRRRLRLSGHIKHQHHGPAGEGGDVGAGAGSCLADCSDAIEQAHRTFGQHQIGAVRRLHQGSKLRGPHRPAIEVQRSAPGRGGMEGRIDVIRPALERLHRQPLGTKRRQQAQHQGGFAGARGGGGYDEAGRNHASSGKRGSMPTGRKRRS